MKNSYLTVTDQFCGAGGSSLGAEAAGMELKLALNHWARAIETHNANFPHAAHDCTDISACNPRRYASTDILITSPECTNHSVAKGRSKAQQLQPDLFGHNQIDPAEERSRATMWDVPRFAEFHNYNMIVVENVVDARQWVMWDAWLHAMALLGYDHKCVYFNSMHAFPTPQSRDRMYVVFWKKKNKAPDLNFRPLAYCSSCGKDVASVQVWKNMQRKFGRYRTQYIYMCADCQLAVEPYYYCAANAIDWSIPAPLDPRSRQATSGENPSAHPYWAGEVCRSSQRDDHRVGLCPLRWQSQSSCLRFFADSNGASNSLAGRSALYRGVA